MLLLIPIHVAVDAEFVSFTFHYASTYTGLLRNQQRRPFHFYIPLCFYLYGIFRMFVKRYCYFTFHYASTYTETIVRKYDRKIFFTFHYASTYTKSSTCITCARTVLHSTMLLLIRSAHLSCWYGLDFTFHYASTYTKTGGITWHYRFILHSTMLLLILKKVSMFRRTKA